MIDELHLELVKLTELLTKEGIQVETGLRYFRNMLEKDSSILSELKVMSYVEKLFGKKFIKNIETPDLISEDNTIAVEVKSFNSSVSLKNAVKLWWYSNCKDNTHKIKQLGTLVLYKDKGIKVYIAIYSKAKNKTELITLDEVLKFFPHEYIKRAKRYALNKQKGRPPKVGDEILLRYYNRYKGYPKKYIWYRLRENGYDISYDRFLRRLKRLVKG